ncbi:MAG: zinc ribbon domain-containing protein, partial [Saccharofermentanales bacterium]
FIITVATKHQRNTILAKKSQPTRSGIFWRIAISAIGMILILMAIGNLLLFFFGDTAQAVVSTRRYGGERQGAVNDSRYTWSVDYSFEADNGTVYEGHLTKLGSATSVSVDRTIYYFPFAPFLNTPEDSAEPNFGQLAMMAAGAFCLIVMNKRPAGPASRPVRHELSDYDDSVENYFCKEDTMNHFCTKCGSALSADARFCPACGAALGPAGPQPSP